MRLLRAKLKKQYQIRLDTDNALYKVSTITIGTSLDRVPRYAGELQSLVGKLGKIRYEESGVWVDIPRKNRLSFGAQAIILAVLGCGILYGWWSGYTKMFISLAWMITRARLGV